MGRLAGTTRLYAVLKGPANTDIFVSDSAFLLTSYSPARSTYAVVKDWGALKSIIPDSGSDHYADIDIQLLANETLVYYDVTSRSRVIDYLRTFHGYDTTVIVYSWNEADQTQFEVWRGYSLGIVGEVLSQDGTTVTLRATARGSPVDVTAISDIVQRESVGWTTAYPNAPTDSLGAMVPRAFGRFYSGITSAQTAPNDAVFLGYGTQGVQGVVTAENIADLKADVEFMRTGSAYDSVLSGTTDDPSAASHFWLHIPEASTYALIDAAGFTATNNGTQVKIQVLLNPTVYVAHRPGPIASTMDTGFNATAYKITNDDPSDYVESDGAGNETWGFEIPSLNIPNFRATDIRLVVDIENASGGTRDVDFGIWNLADTGGASWLGNASKRQTLATLSATRARYYTSAANAYVRADFSDAASSGRSTEAQFDSGTFTGEDGTNAIVPLHAYVTVTSASKNGVRLYGIGVIVKGVISVVRQRRMVGYTITSEPSVPTPDLPMNGWGGPDLGRVTNEFRPEIQSGLTRTYIFTGFGHEDNGTTYEGGSAGDPIRRASAIVHYAITQIGTLGSESRNTTAGTLGNFVDARSEVQAGEKRLSCSFGPGPAMVSDLIREFNVRSSARFYKDRGSWQCVYDEMNPHSSRYYRSTSDLVAIKATEHVVGPVRVIVDDSKSLVNVVTLNYGHTFGSNRPVKAHGYSNPFSIARWGQRRPLVVDEPWVVPEEIGTVPESAKFLAKYHGRANARPRVTLVVPLSLAFYDLQRGHVLGLDTDWESVGWENPYYRSGLCDFAAPRGDVTATDQSDDATPDIIPAGSVTSEAYWGFQSMPTSLTFTFTTDTAAYTEINNSWEYSTGVDSSDEPTWTALSGVTASDAGDPDLVFTRAQSTPVTISYTVPGLHLPVKCERTFGSAKQGPFVWIRHKYNTATNALVGNGKHAAPATWSGRRYEVIEVAHKFTADRYPIIEAVLRECM